MISTLGSLRKADSLFLLLKELFGLTTQNMEKSISLQHVRKSAKKTIVNGIGQVLTR